MEQLSLSYYFENLNDFILPEIFYNINYPWEALKVSKQLIDEMKEQREPSILSEINNCNIKGWVMIGKNTIIDPNVYIEGPAIIGDNCTIKHGALIRPGSIISDNCTLGHGCEVKNTLVFKGAKIQSMTFAGDSIIGRGVRIGSGAITANRRFDQENVGIKINGRYYDFGTDFFGCILGDYCRLGANSVTLPGTLIGSYTWILPLTRVGGFIPKAKTVSGNYEIIIKDNKVIKLKD